MKNNFLFSLIALTIFSSSIKGQGTSQKQKNAGVEISEIGADHVSVSNKPLRNEDIEANIQSQKKKDTENNFVLKSKYLNKDLNALQLKKAIDEVSNSIDFLILERKQKFWDKIKTLEDKLTEIEIDRSEKEDIDDVSLLTGSIRYNDIKSQIINLKKKQILLEEKLMMRYRELQYLNSLK